MRDELTTSLIKLCLINIQRSLTVLRHYKKDLSEFEVTLLEDFECYVAAWLCEIEREEQKQNLQKEVRYVFSPSEVIICMEEKENRAYRIPSR